MTDRPSPECNGGGCCKRSGEAMRVAPRLSSSERGSFYGIQGKCLFYKLRSQGRLRSSENRRLMKQSRQGCLRSQGNYDIQNVNRSLFHVSVLQRCREGALPAVCCGRGALERTGRLPGDSRLYGQFDCGPVACLANHHSIYGGVVPARGGSACLYAPLFSRQDGRLNGPFVRTAHLPEYGGRRL